MATLSHYSDCPDMPELYVSGRERFHLFAPWGEYHGLHGVVLSVCVTPFYLLYSQFYIYCVCS